MKIQRWPFNPDPESFKALLEVHLKEVEKETSKEKGGEIENGEKNDFEKVFNLLESYSKLKHSCIKKTDQKGY